MNKEARKEAEARAKIIKNMLKNKGILLPEIIGKCLIRAKVNGYCRNSWSYKDVFDHIEHLCHTNQIDYLNRIFTYEDKNTRRYHQYAPSKTKRRLTRIRMLIQTEK